MTEIRWELLQPVDTGRIMQGAFQTGANIVKQVQTAHALKAYSANPDDPQALGALAMFNPEMAQTLQQTRVQQQRAELQQQVMQREAEERAAAAAKAAQAERQGYILKGAQIIEAVNPTDQSSWEKARATGMEFGIPEELMPAEYNPEFVERIRTGARALKPQREGNDPSSVREYEYAREGGYGGSYTDFLAMNAGPIITDNGDGTKTITPRSMVSGAPSKGAVPPPPPGFQIVEDGGPTPRASGTFPR